MVNFSLREDIVSLFNQKSETSLERIEIVARGYFRRARDAWVHARAWHNLRLVVSNRWFRTLMPAIIDHEWPIAIKPFRCGFIIRLRIICC